MKTRLNERVMTTEEWRAAHLPHLAPEGGGRLRFVEEDAGHPDGDWVRICCPCGARHTTNKRHDERIR